MAGFGDVRVHRGVEIERSRGGFGDVRVPPKGRYYTILVPFDPHGHSPWHPTTRRGPFKVRAVGAFKTKVEAHAWAKSHLGKGAKYTVRHIPAPHWGISAAGSPLSYHAHPAESRSTTRLGRYGSVETSAPAPATSAAPAPAAGNRARPHARKARRNPHTGRYTRAR